MCANYLARMTERILPVLNEFWPNAFFSDACGTFAFFHLPNLNTEASRSIERGCVDGAAGHDQFLYERTLSDRGVEDGQGAKPKAAQHHGAR
jgi:hypothetical protein